MTTGSQQTNSRRWLLPFLAALIAALAAILLGTTASASATVGAETRVGAFNVAGEVLVEPPQGESPGQRLGKDVPQAKIVVATGVAAKSGDEVADIGHAGLRHQFPNTLPRKSQFFDDIDLGALSSRTRGMDGFLQPNGNTRYVLRHPGGVGVDRSTGVPTDVFTVIRRPDGSVVTMFPGTSPMG